MDATADTSPLVIKPADVLAAYRAQRAARLPGTRKVSADLAPGQVNRELQAALAEFYSAEELALYFDELLQATTAKGGADWRARSAGLQLLLAYMIGKPVERQEILQMNVDADTAVGLEQRLAASPALRAMFKQMIEKIETQSVEQILEAENA